jgi:MtN3 and saliva related transmembrane protein
MQEYIGILAGILATGCLIPQIIRTYKSKSTKDFSSLYLYALWAGVFLWLIYGIIANSFSIILANGVAVFLIGYIIYIKIRYA